eukprot:Sdes_comp19800_c0_seq1m11908
MLWQEILSLVLIMATTASTLVMLGLRDWWRDARHATVYYALNATAAPFDISVLFSQFKLENVCCLVAFFSGLLSIVFSIFQPCFCYAKPFAYFFSFFLLLLHCAFIAATLFVLPSQFSYNFSHVVWLAIAFLACVAFFLSICNLFISWYIFMNSMDQNIKQRCVEDVIYDNRNFYEHYSTPPISAQHQQLQSAPNFSTQSNFSPLINQPIFEPQSENLPKFHPLLPETQFSAKNQLSRNPSNSSWAIKSQAKSLHLSEDPFVDKI